jgi:hypothetical protein
VIADLPLIRANVLGLGQIVMNNHLWADVGCFQDLATDGVDLSASSVVGMAAAEVEIDARLIRAGWLAFYARR